jgi:hypothetical protein
MIIQGLCDAYSKLNDLEKATKEAKKMLSIGESINNPEKMRPNNNIKTLWAIFVIFSIVTSPSESLNFES